MHHCRRSNHLSLSNMHVHGQCQAYKQTSTSLVPCRITKLTVLLLMAVYFIFPTQRATKRENRKGKSNRRKENFIKMNVYTIRKRSQTANPVCLFANMRPCELVYFGDNLWRIAFGNDIQLTASTKTSPARSTFKIVTRSLFTSRCSFSTTVEYGLSMPVISKISILQSFNDKSLRLVVLFVETHQAPEMSN